MENIPGELRKIPPVTRFLLAWTVGISVPAMLGILPVRNVVFDSHAVLQGWEVWRIWTSWFYAPSSELFLFIANVFMLYRASSDLEVQLYEGHSADYAWQTFVSALAIMCLNIPLGTYVFSYPLLHFLIYRNSRNTKGAYMSILDIFYIPKQYLPFIMLALDLITGGPQTLCRALTGTLVAHANYMLIPKPSQLRSHPGASDETPKPLKGWKRHATAPDWMRRVVPDASKGDDAPKRPGGNVRTMGGGGTMGFGYGLYNACAKCVGR